METLIIAAGEGTRLNHYHSPKPLVSISGSFLLEHILVMAKLAGLNVFKIVVGYKAEQIIAKVGSGEKYGLRVEYIHNHEWRKGNGISVYKAKSYLARNFILLMGDHMFESEILTKLIRSGRENPRCLLCVDSEMQSNHIDMKDATKVWTEDHRIQKIGKSLDRFNGIDTGCFFFTPAIFSALEKVMAVGKETLTEANQILADQGKLFCLDIGTMFWLDVDNHEDLREAEKRAQKINSK
jgi:choline kinase